MGGVKKQASKGVFWSLAENLGMRGITFLAFLVFTRLLDKELFGQMALAMAYIAFIELVVRIGVTEVIVQRKALTELDKNTAFWLSASLGLLALVLSLIIAPFASIWSGESELENILYWLSLGIIPLSLTRVQDGIMMRDMRFKGLAVRRILGSGSGAVVGVVCAFNGMGVWSLVAQQLTDRLVDFLTLYWVARWFPRFKFSWQAFKDMADYGSKIMGTNIAYFAGSQLDRILIGHFLGLSALGVYVVGQRLIEVLFSLMNGVVSRVALSAFSKMQHDNERIKKACLSVGQLTVIIGVPMFMFLAASADNINRVIFGEKWIDSAIVTQVLAIATIVRLYFIFLIPALKAKGMAGRVMLSIAYQAIISTCGAIILSPYGLGFMTLGWAIGHGVTAFMLIRYIKQVVSISIKEMLKIYVFPLVASIIAVLFLFFVDSFHLEVYISTYMFLILKMFMFVFVFTGSILIISPQIAKNSLSELLGLFMPKRT